MTLAEALQQFADRCTNDARVREMNRDWTRRVSLLCDDTASRYYLISDAGIVTSGVGEIDNPDLIIQSREDILSQVFSGTLTPTEPYNAGDLLVRGQQDDLMRLDILTLLIWGA
jgi:putative sterol carrier protein